jgi:hypothetical protein
MPGGGLDPERLARLMRTIEGEIVPRLIVSRRLKAAAPVPQTMYTEVLDELDVKEFVRLLLAHDPAVASAYVTTVRNRGAALDAICLDLLAPAARELGLLWEEDECDFMQVTVGLCRLHQVLRELSPAFDCDESPEEGDRGILLVPFPGEQHTFGITLVAQFLRRAGWEVMQVSPDSVADLVTLTRQNFFALVGFRPRPRGAGGDDPRDPRAIAQSQNRGLGRRTAVRLETRTSRERRRGRYRQQWTRRGASGGKIVRSRLAPTQGGEQMTALGPEWRRSLILKRYCEAL